MQAEPSRQVSSLSCWSNGKSGSKARDSAAAPVPRAAAEVGAASAAGVVAFEPSAAALRCRLVSMLHRACTLCLLLLQQRGTSLFAVSSIYLVLLVDDIWGVAALLLRLLHALLQRCMRPAVAASGGAALVAILVSLANPLKDALKDMQLAAGTSGQQQQQQQYQ